MIQVVSQADAARILGVSRPRVHRMLETNKLDSVLVGELRYVTQDSIDDRLNGVQRPRRTSKRERRQKIERLPEVKKCTACKVELTYENSYMRDGAFYTRCTKCHTKSTMFDSYKRNAEKRNLAFRLTRKVFSDLAAKPCAYCGGMHYKGYNGVDRIDSGKGYIPGNVVPACKTCNLAKNNMPIEEWLAWLERIKALPMPDLPAQTSNSKRKQALKE